MEKLNNDVKEYRKRLSLNNVGGGPSPPLVSTQARSLSNSNDFQFAFPKFGDLPSSFMNNGSMAKTSSPNPIGQQRSASSSNPNLPGMTRKQSSSSTNAKSPTSPNEGFVAPPTNGFAKYNLDNGKVDFSNNVEDLNGLFSPSILETASRSNSTDYLSYVGNSTSPSLKEALNGGLTNNQAQKPSMQQQNSSTSLLASPISSVSQNGLDSSCGTTPESSADSPDNRKASEGALNTISEETAAQTKPEGKKTFRFNNWAEACASSSDLFPSMLSKSDCTPVPVNVFKSPGSDVNGIDWMAQQNGGTFDPVLFGDYRDPQDNILNNSFGDFFNDAFQSPVDFTSPYNTGESADPSQPQPQPQKRNLMDEIDLQQNHGTEQEQFISNVNPKQFLTCDKLWLVGPKPFYPLISANLHSRRDRVQSSEKVKSGAADMDELCSQLKTKAKCSGSGAVIEQKEVDRILGPPPTDQQDFLKMFT